MTTYVISQEDHPTGTDMEEIYTTLAHENLAKVGDGGYRRLTIFARDEEGRLLGGIYGFTDRHWLRVEILLVKEAARGIGLGGELLRAAEDEARRRGCRNVWLETFSWQARPFYEHHGYTLFGSLEDYPDEHYRYFLRKSLAE